MYLTERHREIDPLQDPMVAQACGKPFDVKCVGPSRRILCQRQIDITVTHLNGKHLDR